MICGMRKTKHYLKLVERIEHLVVLHAFSALEGKLQGPALALVLC